MVLLDEVAQLGAYEVVVVVELEVVGPLDVFGLFSYFLSLGLVVLYFLGLSSELVEHLRDFRLLAHQNIDVFLSGFDLVVREILLEFLVHFLGLSNVLFCGACVLLGLESHIVVAPLDPGLVKQLAIVINLLAVVLDDQLEHLGGDEEAVVEGLLLVEVLVPLFPVLVVFPGDFDLVFARKLVLDKHSAQENRNGVEGSQNSLAELLGVLDQEK